MGLGPAAMAPPDQDGSQGRIRIVNCPVAD